MSISFTRLQVTPIQAFQVLCPNSVPDLLLIDINSCKKAPSPQKGICQSPGSENVLKESLEASLADEITPTANSCEVPKCLSQKHECICILFFFNRYYITVIPCNHKLYSIAVSPLITAVDKDPAAASKHLRRPQVVFVFESCLGARLLAQECRALGHCLNCAIASKLITTVQWYDL